MSTIVAALSFVFAANAQITYEYATSATAHGPKQMLLDFYPGEVSCSSPRPTVIFIHGGAFRFGNRELADSRGIASDFTAAGINVASVSYRLVGDQPRLSPPFQSWLESTVGTRRASRQPAGLMAAVAAFEDTLKALEYVARNAGRDCVDTHNIFLMGSSAGGVAALSVAYRLDEAGIARPPIRGVVNLWGSSIPAVAIAPGDAPMFIAHGERDRLVPFANSVDYWNRANRVGVPIQLHSFPNKRHGFDLRRTRVGGISVMDLAIGFVLTISAGRPIQTIRTRG